MNGRIVADSTEAWGSNYEGSDRLQHVLGIKHYEMSNHLGNVQAVVSDKRNEDSVTHAYTAGLQGAFDYYPYGMPMRGRHFYNWLSTGSLPEVRTVWVSPSKMVPLSPVHQGWQGCQCNFFPMGPGQMMISASEGPPCNGQLPYVMGWGGVWQDVPVQSNGLPEEIQLQFSSNEIPAVYMEEDMGGGNFQSLLSTPASHNPNLPLPVAESYSNGTY